MNNKTDELKIKENRIADLINMLTLRTGAFLTIEQKAKLQEEGDRLEFRLTELVRESKLKEADIKIRALEAKLEIIKEQ